MPSLPSSCLQAGFGDLFQALPCLQTYLWGWGKLFCLVGMGVMVGIPVGEAWKEGGASPLGSLHQPCPCARLSQPRVFSRGSPEHRNTSQKYPLPPAKARGTFLPS